MSYLIVGGICAIAGGAVTYLYYGKLRKVAALAKKTGKSLDEILDSLIKED